MIMPLKLSVLDQSPIPEGTTAEEALENKVRLAQFYDFSDKLTSFRFIAKTMWGVETNDADYLY